jgi:DNA-directed RNA polymerase specialized sigma24 family protein
VGLLGGVRDLSRFAGRARFSAWLVRIAMNEALACLRKRRRSANASKV